MNSNFWHIWTTPLIVGGISLLGLVAALIGDGLLDVVSWVSLATPLLVIGWFIRKPQPGTRKMRNR